jgi:hypothetical protein
MSNINLGQFYADPLSEIFLKLSFEELLSNYTVNKNWQVTLQGVISKRVSEGVLENYSLNELGNLGKSYPFINTFLIREIHRRLHHNYLHDFLQQFPDANWDYAALSDNSNISITNVLAQPNATWDFSKLSANPNITLEDILNHPELPWDYTYLDKNPNITLADLLAHPEIAWDYQYLNFNPNITMTNILAHPKILEDYAEASTHSNITLADILAHPELPWVYPLVSHNPNITLTDILNYPNIPWMYSHVFYKNISIQDMENHPELPWDYDSIISFRYDVTMRDVLNYSDHKINYKFFSKNPNLTLKEILAHPELPWDYSMVSRNVSITLKEMLAHPEIPWNYNNYNSISSNPGITVKDVLAHPEIPWNFGRISENNFSKDGHYFSLAKKIIRSLLPEKIPVLIKGQKRVLTAETVYGLILGLTATNKIQTNPVTFYGITLDLDTAEIFFSTKMRATKYLIYIQDKPYHFQDLSFLSALKSAGVPLTKFYDKSAKYAEKSII